MKIRGIATFYSLLCVGLLAAGGAHAAEYRMTAGSSHPPIVPWAKNLKTFVVPQSAMRAKKLGHKIKWVEAYSGVLYDFKETLEGVGDGRADVGWVGTLWEPVKLPMHNISFAAPFGSTNVAKLTKIMGDIYKAIPAVGKRWKKYNVKLLGYFAVDEYVLLTRKPIKKFTDLKGLQLYTPGSVARWLEGTGAIGINAGLPAMYDGVKKGTADGLIVPSTGVLPFKLHEVAPYVTRIRVGAAIGGALAMNLDTWKKLPPEMQKLFLEIGKQYSQRVIAQITGFSRKTFAILGKHPKVTLTSLPMAEQKKWAKALPNIAGQWVKTTKAKGLPARQVLHAYMAGLRKAGETPLRDWDKEN